MTKSVIAKLSATPEKFLENDLEAAQLHSQECLYPYIKKKKLPHETELHQTPSGSTTPVEVTLSATPEKFLEDDLKSIQLHSQGCLYPYLEKKKLLDGTIAFYPRVIGQRDPDNPIQWRWGFNWEERVDGVWKGRSIGSISPGAVPMIRLMQQQGAIREDIIAFIKKAKTKKTSPKSDVCKNFDNTKLKPVLPDDAPIAVVLFAGGGGIEAGMVQAGIRPVIAVEFDPSKPELSRAIALNHHRNFHEYGCKIIQLTVQEVAQLGFIGFPRRPDYLHASPVCANFSQAHTAKAGIALETADDLSAASAVAEAIRQLKPRVFTLENVLRYQNSQSFSIILQVLKSEGYSVDYSVVNMADFGLPQARRRLVLVASRGFRVALPSGATPCGWYRAIAHLIPTMPDSQLLPKQQQALEKFLAGNAPRPLLIERVGGRKLPKYKPGSQPANTILRSHFTDHKGCNRSKFADIWLPDGTVKSLSIEGAAILQGFPSWYEFPNETATAGSIIGYSVPPSGSNTTIYICTEQIIRSDCMTNLVQNLEQCWYTSPPWGQNNSKFTHYQFKINTPRTPLALCRVSRPPQWLINALALNIDTTCFIFFHN